MNCQGFLDTLTGFSSVLAVKLYRIQPEITPPVPTLPCLDHEAVLHERIGPHAAAYIEDRSGNLHEIVFVPDERRVYVDVVSTLDECTPESHHGLLATLRSKFPDYRVRVLKPSWVKGDQRAAEACRAQITLREVLTGDHLDRTKIAIDRLQTISSLMEKESRVASWGARTVTTPFLAVAGFLTYQVVGTFSPQLGAESVALLQYGIVGLLGAVLVYIGLKAVHLTQMANRVWKRAAEYGLIVGERRRLAR